MTTPTIYIIDMFSLMFQVFHAIPPMRGTRGQPTNAVFGMTRDLLALRETEATHMVCAFDSPGPGERSNLYPEYKANRSEMPEDLVPQIALIQELVDGLRIPQLQLAGWEADDVIATVATRASESNYNVVIVSSDKDVRQLLADNIRIYNCRKQTFYDSESLQQDWGVRPDQVIDFQSLVGDSVDNVPGVPLVGPKKAQGLIADHGTLDDILAAAPTIKAKKLSQNLQEFADQARISRELVTLKRDLPLALDLDAAEIQQPDRERLFALFSDLGFRRYAADMRPDGASDTETPAQQDPLSFLTTEDSVTGVIKEISTAKSVAVWWSPALHHPRPEAPQFLAVLPETGRGGCVSLDAGGVIIDPLLDALASHAGKLVGENTGHLLQWLMTRRKAKPSQDKSPFDLGVADYLLDAGVRSHTLSAMAERYGLPLETAVTAGTSGKKQLTLLGMEEEEDTDSVRKEAESRLRTIIQLRQQLTDRLQTEQLEKLWSSLERPLVPVLAKMEYTGVRVNAEELHRQNIEVRDRIDTLTEAVHSAAGHEFNIDSPKQLRTVLFDELELPVIKKTKTGASTDHEVLEKLAEVHELPRLILERRSLVKLSGTYLEALPKLIHKETGRIHSRFHQTVAATGRLSSSDPNLQNIPIRTSEGRQVRRAFEAADGFTLFCADYSQIELRILAHYSQDEALLDAFRRDRDIHAAVAADVFSVPEDQVTKEMRRVAKAVNFGVIYGQSPFGLAAALQIDQAEAAVFIEGYFERYAGVARFCEEVLTETAESGFARTIRDRRRPISGIRRTTGIQRNMPERTAINTVIQGSAADLIKQAMLDIDLLIRDEPDVRLLLQIHDELVFEIRSESVDEWCPRLLQTMQNAMQLDVPLTVDGSLGQNWLEQKDL